jgi:sec-independent protein translocase protein TatC
MTRGERKTLLPVVFGSVILFIFGLACGYFFLAPAALNFFINYGSDVVEPFWSFEQYFEFILVLLFSTGLAFQLPVIQVVFGSLKIFSSRLMFSVWRYVILGSTIIGAILTPSVDPVTQIFMSSIIMVLYFGGAGLVYLIERSQSDTQTA